MLNESIQGALNELYSLLALHSDAEDVNKARKFLSDEILRVKAAGDDVTEACAAALKVDAEMKLAGYNSDRKSLSVTLGGNTGGEKDRDGKGNEGFAPDVKTDLPPYLTGNGHAKIDPSDIEDGQMKNQSPSKVGTQVGHADATPGLTPEMIAFFQARMNAEVKAEADAKRKEEISAACEDARKNILSNLTADEQEYVLSRASIKAEKSEDVAKMVADELSAYSSFMAKARLAGGGYQGPSAETGQTTVDTATASGRAYITKSATPWLEHVEKLCSAADEYRRTVNGFDPESSETVKLRAYNRTKFINPLIEDMAARHKSSKTAQEWFAKEDALLNGGEKALCDAIDKAAAVADSVTTANLFNQPTISTALLIQQFQDLEALQFVQGIGPGLETGAGTGGFQLTGNAGDGRVGSVLRIPVEYYTSPSGYGTLAAPQYDAGLLVPEDTGIDEAQINTTWMAFPPVWRRIAISLTRDTIRAMGNGPLNYPAVARALFHIAYDKSRRIDKALYDEMLQTSDEYGAVGVTAEAPNLANNSVYAPGGSVTVNLNPTKIASAAVVATDAQVTYGANVVAAVRLQTAGSGTASPYAGTTAGLAPAVRPRANVDLTASGQVSSNITTPFTVTVAGGTGAAAVIGYLDTTGQVQSMKGVSGVANCAIDYNNGVVVFTSAFTAYANSSGVAAAALASTVTFTYSYATNYDNFVVTNPALAVGETPSRYYNRLIGQIDQTAAKMGSSPRFIKPNLALMSLNASTWLTQAEIFFKLNSPDGTRLFPTENYFFERTGVKGARINSPWFTADTRILLTRSGTTKYAIDTPFEIRGPYPAYDMSTGNIKAKEIYYGEENSIVATPQVKNAANVVLNPVSRTICLR